MKFPGAGGSFWFVTAGGKLLGSSPSEAILQWQSLPDAERAPAAVTVEELGQVDPKYISPSPPAGSLILKLYYRAFMRQDGQLRYVTGKDLCHDENGNTTEEAWDVMYPGSLSTPQAQPDHLWLTQAEWKSLIPAEPQKGARFPMPKAITERLCRWHLNPLLVYGEANPLSGQNIRAVELTLTVARVTPAILYLQLDGSAQLGEGKEPEAGAASVAYRDRWGYKPCLLGFLEYNRRRQAFQRFDMVAFGDHYGKLGIADSGARPGLQPLGIAFELANSELPAEQIPPGRTLIAKSYFAPDK
jgi:hypothetical protein